MSNAPISLADLETLTGDHWARNDSTWYIQNLLGHEMEYAQQQVEDCDTLALMVGFSPDPLLQTIWKYRPERIVLVLNHKYGKQPGKHRADEYVMWIGQMVSMRYCPSTAATRLSTSTTKQEDIAIAKTEAQPDWVFRELRDRLLRDQRAGKRIVVDITGAKKNMASGAFLFAAYAGADISYVDFEEYHPEKRRPLGYTCRIGTQPNPYRILGLRDWERVQKLYEQFAFGSAAMELQQLAISMGDGLASAAGAGSYFSDEQRQAVDRSIRVMSALDQWDNGDFTSAWKLWSENEKDGTPSLQSQMPEFRLPQAIQYLGSRGWPSAAATDANTFLQQHRDLKRGTATPEDSIFNQPDLLLTYAFDELDKIRHLIDQQNDYRSAFLRSAGLDELLLKARVAILWLTNRLQIDGNPAVQLTQDKTRYDVLAESASAGGYRTFLQDPNETLQFRVRGGFTVRRSTSDTTTMDSYWNLPNYPIDHEILVKLRGEAIHTHLSIPAAYADAAYHIADSALKDFNTKWVAQLNKPSPLEHQTWQLPWSELCTHCGLDFLPALPSTKERAT